MKNVIVVGTFDTKGLEFDFIKGIIEKQGVTTTTINTGIIGGPLFEPDITNEEVAIAGGSSIMNLKEKNDRGHGIDVMMLGASKIVKKLYDQGKVDGVISLGGSAGTTIGTFVMRSLPVGVPKIMVSTVASGDTRPYVGEKDITMMYSVVDISGINSISNRILANAANAITGMVSFEMPKLKEEKPLIAASMFGVTTPCVTVAREYLEDKGYEVLVFHATGAGGMALESLVEAGFIKGVLDVTTTEWCDEIAGGVFSAGPTRLEAAGKVGIPEVVSVGALDMVNFGAMDTVPQKYQGRNLYKHNASVTLMRTTKEECSELGKIIASKLNMATGPAVLFLPLKGVSAIDVEGATFYGPEEDKELFKQLRENVNDCVEVVELDTDINDETFALAMAKKLIELIEN
ncbi:MAG: Tm-1-like ATP-binding domain-containing protein [Eubacteriaceae bacterium]